MQTAFLPTSLEFYESPKNGQSFTIEVPLLTGIFQRKVTGEKPNLFKDIAALLLSDPDKKFPSNF